MNKATKFSLAIIFQVLVIATIILLKMMIVTSGTEVLLSIKPVDPRDPLRGDYVSFRYDISTIEDYQTRGQVFREGDVIYVILTTRGKRATVQGVSDTLPSAEKTFIKGMVTRIEGSNQLRGMTTKSNTSKLHVTYGIEQYFIPEGSGRSLPAGNTAADARVYLDERGNAVVKQIFIDGKSWP